MFKKLKFTSEIWAENGMFVAYNPELDISSCGRTVEEARQNLSQALRLFLEETKKMGTWRTVLEEAGFAEKESEGVWQSPEFVAIERLQVAF